MLCIRLLLFIGFILYFYISKNIYSVEMFSFSVGLKLYLFVFFAILNEYCAFEVWFFVGWACFASNMSVTGK